MWGPRMHAADKGQPFAAMHKLGCKPIEDEDEDEDEDDEEEEDEEEDPGGGNTRFDFPIKTLNPKP